MRIRVPAQKGNLELKRMDIYEPLHHMNSWGDFNDDGCTSTCAFGSPGMETELDNQVSIFLKSEDDSHGILAPSIKYDQEANKPSEKMQRRLAQNREAARKSRLRKKAYVRQLEIGHSKLIQLQQELNQAREQGVYTGGGFNGSQLEYSETADSGIAAFEVEYGRWLEEQAKQISELRNALNGHASDNELQRLVDGGMCHYARLFHIKAVAAEADVFYVMSCMWKTVAERFFSWIGGVRPSMIFKVTAPHLEPLTEQQRLDISGLKESCQQAEDALSKGMENLQQTLSESVVDGGQFGEGTRTMEKLDSLVGFMGQYVRFCKQADHLREQTLQQMTQILGVRQVGRGLLAWGDYLHRLRSLSSLWASRLAKPVSSRKRLA